MKAHHVRRRRTAVSLSHLAGGWPDDPTLALVAAVFRQAHRDARYGNKGAAMWLSEMQRRTLETLAGRRV